jgi:molybdopterin-guanine dinucleotide biosynthesis protein A
VIAILAGGLGTRLGGQSKSLLVVGGQRIIDRQLAAIGHLDRVVIVANDHAPFVDLGLQIVRDRYVGAGPLAALDVALTVVEPGDVLLAVAGDMPFITPAALMLLRTHPDAQAVVPRLPDGVHPLFARYARSCAQPIAHALADVRLKTQAILAELAVTYLEEPTLRAIDPELNFLMNVNTPEDLARAEALAAHID